MAGEVDRTCRQVGFLAGVFLVTGIFEETRLSFREPGTGLCWVFTETEDDWVALREVFLLDLRDRLVTSLDSG